MAITFTRKQKRLLTRLAVGFVIYAIVMLIPEKTWGIGPNDVYISLVFFLIPYLIVGYDVLLKAGRNILHGQLFDENFLMSIATIGSFALVIFPDSGEHFSEAAAVMLFYQVGEFFQNYAVGRSRQSIAAMMDIAPEYANLSTDQGVEQVDPSSVSVGDTIVVKPGERVPLDGIVLTGESQLDTAALTGEAVPRRADVGDEVLSGCINMSGVLTVRVTKLYGDSTVQRILELVENASDKKARTENFITRFAHYYTPAVVMVAVLLAVIPPICFGQAWSQWVERGLVFLVVSCPCALVISVPLSFFGGIGGASRLGILVKGGNYLETLGLAGTVVFDKTGTLTDGSFRVVAVNPVAGLAPEALVAVAAKAEAYSTHPIALSIREYYDKPVDPAQLSHVEEISGEGVSAELDHSLVLVGNDKLMASHELNYQPVHAVGTVLYVAQDGRFLGSIVIADAAKPDAAYAIAALHEAGVKHTVMLTGDRDEVAAAMCTSLGIDEYHAELLPQDKVSWVEALLTRDTRRSKLVFVGDGINDAPVLMRADVGIAMGAMGSDAAIEAADIVLMDDKPSHIATAVLIARKTMRIVWQNIIMALGVKFAVLVLAFFGFANLWLAVFADVGVAVIAILNAMRAMRVKQLGP